MIFGCLQILWELGLVARVLGEVLHAAKHPARWGSNNNERLGVLNHCSNSLAHACLAKIPRLAGQGVLAREIEAPSQAQVRASVPAPGGFPRHSRLRDELGHPLTLS